MKFSSLTEIQQLLQTKKISPQELWDFYIDRIQRHNKGLNAFLTLNEKAFDKQQPKKGPLAHIPIAVKDMFCVKGLSTTAGSRILKSYIPPYTATAVQKLISAGALIIGKCNMDEFAMGSTGENSAFGPAKNPWNLRHSPGGSSSGSAVAVAGGLCPAALGTDTGGSVRLPAHYCHLVGVKPSYGRVSRYGMISYASSLDQAGLFSHTVKDSALLLDIISGFDEKDATTAKLPPPHFQKNLEPDIKGQKVICFDWEEFGAPIAPCVIKAQNQALRILKDRGCIVEKQKPPSFFEYGVSVYYLISTAEASSNLARYDGLRYGNPGDRQNLQEFYSENRAQGFGREVQRRIIMGAFCLSSGYYEDYFHKAALVRQKIKQAFDEMLSKAVAILSPVSAGPAPRLEEKTSPLALYLNDRFTALANLTGCPALSLPAGFSEDRLPVGVQLTGRAFGEQELLNMASALEADLGVHKERPSFDREL